MLLIFFCIWVLEGQTGICISFTRQTSVSNAWLDPLFFDFPLQKVSGALMKTQTTDQRITETQSSHVSKTEKSLPMFMKQGKSSAVDENPTLTFVAGSEVIPGFEKGSRDESNEVGSTRVNSHLTAETQAPGYFQEIQIITFGKIPFAAHLRHLSNQIYIFPLTHGAQQSHYTVGWLSLRTAAVNKLTCKQILLSFMLNLDSQLCLLYFTVFCCPCVAYLLSYVSLIEDIVAVFLYVHTYRLYMASADENKPPT